MGLTYANIEILNGDDVADFERKKIGEDEIRSIEVNALVDTGSIMLAISEDLRAALGLRVIAKRTSILADGSRQEYPVATNVMVRCLGRFCLTNALVLPDFTETLLGAIPMEEMDLYVHPVRNEIAPFHPDGQVMVLK